MGASFSTTKSNNKWAVRKDGSSGVFSTHRNKGDAWAETRRLARGSGGQAYLRDSDGRIRAQNSYEGDASKRKG